MTVLALASLLAAIARAPTPPPVFEGSASPRQFLLSEAFFERADVPRLEIEIPAPDIARLRAEPRTVVHAVVREGDAVYRDVALHLKGGIGSFRPVDDKPGLTLNFDYFLRGQKFHEIDKALLNNCAEDSSFVRDILAGDFFRCAGVPAARARVVRVTLNHRDLGLYSFKEGLDRSFLKLHFIDPDGATYDPGTVGDIDDIPSPSPTRYPVETGDIETVVDAAQEPDLALRWQRLAKVVDLDRFISFIAVEALLAQFDGYAFNTNNYRLFFDPRAHRFVFIPGTADQILEQDCPFYTDGSGMLAAAVLETEAGRRRFDARLLEIHRQCWDRGRLIAEVRRIQGDLRPALVPHEVSTHERAIRDLIDQIGAQDRAIDEHITLAAAGPLVFDAAGVASPSGWQPAAAPGQAAPDRIQTDGIPALHLARGCDGAWQTSVILHNGRYRFQGRARTEGGPRIRDRIAGARLTAGSEKGSPRAARAGAWCNVSVDFKVDGPLEAVTLTCERTGATGAWFDLGSLRVVRLPE